MRFVLLSVLVVALQSASIIAQSTLSTSTSSSKPSVQTIYVAKGDHTFNKNSITANVGDLIVFEFYDSGHSVIQAEYNYPCMPYGTVNPLRPGFYSGNMTLTKGAPTLPTFSVTIKDTSPMFYYCGKQGSCNEQKMIGVINPTSNITLSHQLSLITKDTRVLQPGMPLPDETTASATSSTATSTASSTTSSSASSTISSAPASTSSASSQSSPHVALSTGAISGIAVGGAIVIALVGALFWYMSRSRILKQTLDQQQQRGSGFQHPPKDGFFSAYSGDSDGRGSVSYAGSPPPDKARARTMETVYDVDRHGSPELDGWGVPEISNVAGYSPRGRSQYRESEVSEMGNTMFPAPLSTRNSAMARPIHELG